MCGRMMCAGCHEAPPPPPLTLTLTLLRVLLVLGCRLHHAAETALHH